MEYYMPILQKYKMDYYENNQQIIVGEPIKWKRITKINHIKICVNEEKKIIELLPTI